MNVRAGSLVIYGDSCKSTECIRCLEEDTHTHTHKKKTWNKLERSRVLSHSFTTDANAPLLFEMLVCFTEWHCSSWPSRVVRDYLIIFRILDSASSLTIISLEYGLGYAILSAFYFVQAILSIQFSICEHRSTAKKVNEHRITARHSIDCRSTSDRYVDRVSTDVAVDIGVDITYSKHDPKSRRNTVTIAHRKIWDHRNIYSPHHRIKKTSTP